MLEKLSEVLRKATNRLLNSIFVDKNLVDTIIRDLQRALIEADVNILLVKQLTDKIKNAALDERIKGIEKKEHLIKLLHDELVKILGEYKPLKLKKERNKLMFVGLYGAGKTTSIAKIGNYYAKRGNKVALVGLDVHRPAASEQLKQLAEKNKLSFFIDEKEKDPIKIWKTVEPKLKGYNLVLIDTAGRHNLDKELEKEIKQLNEQIAPTEIILVMPADIGQAASSQAQQFQDAVKISGVIITRMDSTAKAGGALTACAETNSPIYFIGTGEKVNDIEEFEPKGFLARLLGMGDLQNLIEKIKSVTGEDEQEKIQKKIEQGKISLQDVVEQVSSMSSIGGIEKIKSMIPGFGNAKIPDNILENQQGKIEKWPHILKSMTREEIENPELLKKEHTRVSRIAKGAGVPISDIKALLKQYDLLNEMISSGIASGNMDMSKGFSEKQMRKLMKKFGKIKKVRF